MTDLPLVADPIVEWSRLRVTGSDAGRFVQGQVTQDVVDLDEPRWSLLLAPDGTVLTTAWVSASNGELAMDVPRELGPAALARLVRFRLRVDCEVMLEDVDSGPFTRQHELIEARWPGAAELSRGLGPHSYGAALVAATVSFDKGCFTGQELVARLQSRGAPVPWRLVYAEGASVERIDEVLTASGPEGPRGVTSAVERNGGVAALGFAHRSVLNAELLDTHPDVLVEAAS